MAKILCVLFLVFNFASYVFAHGGCSPSDKDMARCEMKTDHQDDCSENSDAHKDHQTESNGSFHLCGCIGVFVYASPPDIFHLPDVKRFSIQKSKIIEDQFQQRIDRPPIRHG